MAAPSRGANRSMRDKERAAELKRRGVERRHGICAVCYKPIPNDTFGGSGAMRHYPGACCNEKQ